MPPRPPRRSARHGGATRRRRVAGAGRKAGRAGAPGRPGRGGGEGEALARAGLRVPEGRRAADRREAVAAATALGFRWPSRRSASPTNRSSARSGWGSGTRRPCAKRRGEMAGLGTGLHVERMVTGGVAELIVGVVSDPVFGPVMTLGSGGVLVELLQDSATLLLPASRDEVEAALRGLKLFPLLDGFRGRPRADLEAAVDAVLKIAAFVLDHPGGIEELDVNPLIVCARRARAPASRMRCWSAPGRKSMAEVVTTRREGAHPRGHARPAQGQRHRPEDLAADGRDVQGVPGRPRIARRHREDGRRQVFLAPAGISRQRPPAMRSTATTASAASAGCRNCAT